MNKKTSRLWAFNGDFLSLNQTKALQAIACIGVLLHHVTQQVTSNGTLDIGPIKCLATVGFLFTAIFFFCSGYGLVVSLYSKDNYLDHFLFKRLSTIFVPFFTANIIFVIAKLCIYGRVGSTFQTMAYITGLVLINSNGWYIIEIFVLYLAFYILFKLIKKKDLALVLLCAFTVGLVLYSKGLGHDNSTTDVNGHWFMGEWWYNSTLTFVLGLIVARFKDSLIPRVKKYYWIIAAILLVLLPIGYQWADRSLKLYGYYNQSFKVGELSYSTRTLIPQTVFCIIFVIAILLINLKISFSNKVLIFISKISLELFLIQKLFIEYVFGSMHMPHMVRYLAVILCSGVTAWVLSHLNKLLLKGLNKLASNLPDIKITNQIKQRKKLLVGLVAICAIGFFIYKIAGIVLLRAEYQDEIASLEKAKPGDQVYYGRYDTSFDIGDERVPWLVVDVKDGKYTLLCRDAIGAGSFNDSQKEIAWRDSYIRKRLNSEEFLSMFSSVETEALCMDENGDLVSLLTVEQANTYFSNDTDRQVGATEIAESKGVNANEYSKMNKWDYNVKKASWWWLRGNNTDSSKTAPYVSVDGEIVEDKALVSKSAGAIRPLIIVDLGVDIVDKDTVEDLGQTEKEISAVEDLGQTEKEISAAEEFGPYQVTETEGEGCFDFFYDEYNHRIIICQPAQIDEETDMILMLHGYGSKASDFQRITGMDENATKRNYIVVYITGAPEKNDPTSSYGWNASWNCGLRPSDKDDVGFLRAVRDFVKNKYQLKSDRAFVAGFSNGGAMTFRLAYEAANTFTACASVSGKMPADMWDQRGENRTTSFLQINGTNDNEIPMKLTGTESYNNDPAIEDVIEEMARVDQCEKCETAILSKEASITKYTGQTEKQIWEVVITGGTHCWPDQTMAGFDVNELILDFFQEFRN